MQLRPYQQETIDQLYSWWMQNPGIGQNPLCVLPTGAGKSLCIAELARLLFETWPDDHPRTVVIVPSKELAEQNAEKLRLMLPKHISVGYYSASLGQRDQGADVIVATIGSIYRHAHQIGNIRCVVIDEAHLVNPNGEAAGRYRQFLSNLARYCQFRVVGFTATPFRGNGVWLTEGEFPLFSAIAHVVSVQELLRAGYLAPLVRPVDVIGTHIDTDGISTSNGDFNVGELSDLVTQYLPALADEACRIAAVRRKWIGFTASVANASQLANELRQRGVASAVVTGDTPKGEREDLIRQFKAGELRCLVTVLALATGFDVPDVDCILWCRPTRSPVLYVQGAGRGMRIAPGKTDCLWLDFSDTSERMGPVDTIAGHSKRTGKGDSEAPYALCPSCNEVVRPASLMECPHCGATMREQEEQQAQSASNAAILSTQLSVKLVDHDVTDVTYSVHRKEGKPDSLRVDYWSGMGVVASEWVCFDHPKFAGERARAWWHRRSQTGDVPASTAEAKAWIEVGGLATPRRPSAIRVNDSGRWPEIVGFHWEQEATPCN